MSWRDWLYRLYKSTIEGLLQHAVACLSAGIVFSITGWVLSLILPKVQTGGGFIELSESILIDCIFVIFGLRLVLVTLMELVNPIKDLWRLLRGGWNGTNSIMAL
jgi:hypothetical protein